MNTDDKTLPTHLGLILDGNRRWAKSRGLPTLEGHRKGYENLKIIAKASFEAGIEYVSAFIFSTENWNRTKEETTYLMNLALRIAEKDSRELLDQGVKIVMLGSKDRVPEKVVTAFKKIESESKNNTKGTLALCFNYGGYQEITDAVKQIVKNGVSSNEITEETISKHIYHPEVPPVDFIIRTSGEQRLSNFMLWRAAYSELLFVDTYWPDFSRDDLSSALVDYAQRNRRFGGN